MIDFKEVRVGNWVEHAGGKKPKMITVEDFWSHYDNQDGKDRFYYYDPIPLTPDILIKAGFVNVRDNHWCVPSSKASNSFEVCLWPDHVSYTKGNNHHVEINYLHQLQNLYYSLTQQELQINF